MQDELIVQSSPQAAVPDGPEEDGWRICGLTTGAPEFSLYAAPTLSVRRRAYGLAYLVYRGLEYIPPREDKIFSTPFDEDPSTLVLYVEDLTGDRAGTLTLYYDSPRKLPCDEVYGEVVDELRRQGRRPVEVTRLAISENHRRSTMVLARLFNFILLHAYFIRRKTDFIIEVNPRHVRYYEKTLCFKVIGPERSCPRVGGAPAVLMRLNFDDYRREITRLGGKYLDTPHHQERLWYANFYPPSFEPEVVRFLRRYEP